MTGLLEFKHKMRTFYSHYDTFIFPVLKFILALISFCGINSSMGFMSKLNNIFVVLILALLCSILPLNMIVVVGFILITGHCYALGLEVAGFALLLLVLLAILLLRFSVKDNLALILAPVAFTVKIPTAIPIGCGLLRTPASAIPASCGVILYSFTNLLKDKETVLKSTETEKLQKMKLLLDGLIKNQDMWLTILAFIIVILIVFVIRKMAVDYSWRIAVVVGGIVYVAVMVAGGLFLEVKISIGTVVLSAGGSILIGFILEFFGLGVDYSRTENLQYEDDEYVYYVKAVPKAYVTASNRKIKTINSGTSRSSRARRPRQTERDAEASELYSYLDDDLPLEKVGVNDVDFEKKLESSLRDL